MRNTSQGFCSMSSSAARLKHPTNEWGGGSEHWWCHRGGGGGVSVFRDFYRERE